MNLDPQIAALLDTLDAGFPPVHTMTGAQARAVIRSRFVPAAEPEPVGEVRDDVVPGPGGDIPVRIYRPPATIYRCWCTPTAAGSCSATWTATMPYAGISSITLV